MRRMGIRQYFIAGIFMAVLTVLCLGGLSGSVHAKGISASKVRKMADKTVKKQTKKVSKKDKAARLERVFAYADEKFAYQANADKAFVEATLQKQLSDGNLRSAAYTMLKKRRGTCIHEAAALAYLIRRATGYPTQMVIGQTDAFTGKSQLHAWVEASIDGAWFVFDSNLDRSKGKTRTWFRIPADGSDRRYEHYTAVWRKAV